MNVPVTPTSSRTPLRSRPTHEGLRGRLRGVPLELGFVVAALLLNALVRWYTLEDEARAVANARDVLALQERLHLDWEHAVQDATLTLTWLDSFTQWFYVWGYFPVVVVVLVGLYVWRPDTYPLFRNALLVSGAIGLLCYAFYPTAPPRLTDPGYVDTVATGVLDAAARPVGIANELGAIPSFHVGWLALSGYVVHRVTRSAVLRVLCVLVPATMAYAVVATGNHWVLDIPAGVAVALVGLLVARTMTRATHRGEPDG